MEDGCAIQLKNWVGEQLPQEGPDLHRGPISLLGVTGYGGEGTEEGSNEKQLV